MNSHASLHDWIQRLSTQLQRAQIRACLLLEGDRAWQEPLCQQYLQHPPTKSGIWVGKNSPFATATAVLPNQASHQLGQETDFVIFSADEGIDPNTLGILSGMIRAGGLCIILLPEHQAWLKMANIASQKHLSYPYQADDSLKGFNAYLWQKLSQHAIHIRQGQAPETLDHWLAKAPLGERAAVQSLPTADQREAIEYIKHVALGHRKRPLMMTADRGRGKSTALGLAAVDLIRQGKQNIAFTAARRDQLVSALQPVEAAGLNAFIHVYAPDELIAHPRPVDILMVDEAAHLPLPILEKLLNHYPRVVFSSTLKGYEGSGRGFGLKFAKTLESITPGWKRHTLKTPIRWQTGDWLETTLNETLLFNETMVDKRLNNMDAPSFRVLNTHQLLENPQQLNAIFQLLVSAHYQTSPNDLMQLLDSPNLTILVAQKANIIVGVLLATSEGNLPVPTTSQPKRYQGHLFPQRLYQQTYHPAWLELQGLRIMRIAVHENAQRQKLGTQLLNHCQQLAQDQSFDYVASSFGATPELIPFWTKNAYQVCGLGLKKDHASGTYSISVCHPLSSAAKTLVSETQALFRDQFVYLLSSQYKNLETPTLLALLSNLPFKKTKFPEGYLAQQPYESLSLLLRDWVLGNLTFLTQLTETSLQQCFIQKLLHDDTWAEVVYPNLPSRKQVEQALKSALSAFLIAQEHSEVR